jgi:hypothetical protein
MIYLYAVAGLACAFRHKTADNFLDMLGGNVSTMVVGDDFLLGLPWMVVSGSV